MSLVGLAIHIALLSLAVAILIPAGLTILALLIYETARDPDKPAEYRLQGGKHTVVPHDPLPAEFWDDCLPCRTGYPDLCTEEHKPSNRAAFFIPKTKEPTNG